MICARGPGAQRPRNQAGSFLLRHGRPGETDAHGEPALVVFEAGSNHPRAQETQAEHAAKIQEMAQALLVPGPLDRSTYTLVLGWNLDNAFDALGALVELLDIDAVKRQFERPVDPPPALPSVRVFPADDDDPEDLICRVVAESRTVHTSDSGLAINVPLSPSGSIALVADLLRILNVLSLRRDGDEIHYAIGCHAEGSRYLA